MHLKLRGTVIFSNGTKDEGQGNMIFYFFLYINAQNLNFSLLILVYQLLFISLCFFFALENHGGVLSK